MRSTKYVCDIVVKKFTFAISSCDEFLFYLWFLQMLTDFYNTYI